MSGRTFLLEGEFLHATDDAVLFDVEGDEVWIPRRCITDGDFDPDDHERHADVEVEIEYRMAKDKGLVE